MIFRAHIGCRTRQAGFSLIELMAASVILGVAVSGVMAMIGAGSDYEIGMELRRQAGILARSKLEETSYFHSNYLAMASSAPQDVTLNTTGAPVPGTMTVAVTEGSLDLPRYPNGIISVPFKTVLVKVRWVAMQPDSVVLSKRVVKAIP